jgi:hypothetical protein
MLQDFLPILQNYVRNSDAQHDCLQALEVSGMNVVLNRHVSCEISVSHGSEYEDGCLTRLHGAKTQKIAIFKQVSC